MKHRLEYCIELKARNFMEPTFIKTISHELIHYFYISIKSPTDMEKCLRNSQLK